MKTISDYAIYCTEDQTKKSLELGAPISEAMSRYNSRLVCERIKNGKETREDYNKKGVAILGNRTYNIPTAEQMIGWLGEQGINISIEYYTTNLYSVSLEGLFGYIPIGTDSRKEATIAAIDAALEYLTQNKK